MLKSETQCREALEQLNPELKDRIRDLEKDLKEVKRAIVDREATIGTFTAVMRCYFTKRAL